MSLSDCLHISLADCEWAIQEAEREREMRWAKRTWELKEINHSPPAPVLDRTGKDDAFGGDTHIAWCVEEERLVTVRAQSVRDLQKHNMCARPRTAEEALEQEEKAAALLIAYAHAANAHSQHWYSRPPSEPDWLLGIDPTFTPKRLATIAACGTWNPPARHSDMKARLARIAKGEAP
jgi:hypothetical protein